MLEDSVRMEMITMALENGIIRAVSRQHSKKL